MKKDFIRQVRFSPYAKDNPRFSLTVWDTHQRDGMGKNILGYRLTLIEIGVTKSSYTTIFQGEDFHCAPLEAIDSDATINALMDFLTLCPGDTDAEYFANYTPEQLEFCSQHAEALSYEIERRFGNAD